MTAARTDDGRIWTRRTTVKWRTIDGETVVLDTEQSKYLLLNDTATTLWPRACKDGSRKRPIWPVAPKIRSLAKWSSPEKVARLS